MRDMPPFDAEMVKAGIDLLGLTVTLGVMFDHLPQISAALSAVWFALRIGEWLAYWFKRK